MAKTPVVPVGAASAADGCERPSQVDGDPPAASKGRLDTLRATLSANKALSNAPTSHPLATEPLSIAGSSPLYRTADAARAASPNQDTHSMMIGGEIYWMPSAMRSVHDASLRDGYHGDAASSATAEALHPGPLKPLADDPVLPFGQSEPFAYEGHYPLYYSIDAAKEASPSQSGYAVTINRFMFYKPAI